MIDIMSEKNLLLIGALAVVDFRSCEESIQKATLALFTRMAERRPEVLLLLYDHLLEYLDEVLNSSHNPMLLKEANALMCVVSMDSRFANRGSAAKETLAYRLARWGLSGIWTATSFRSTKEFEKRCAGLTDRLIEVCIS
jgi:neurofibromin 1